MFLNRSQHPYKKLNPTAKSSGVSVHLFNPNLLNYEKLNIFFFTKLSLSDLTFQPQPGLQCFLVQLAQRLIGNSTTHSKFL